MSFRPGRAVLAGFEYANGKPLTRSVNSMIAMYALMTHGKCGNLNPERVVILTDCIGTNITERSTTVIKELDERYGVTMERDITAELLSKWKPFNRRLLTTTLREKFADVPGELALFFFSGHGIVDQGWQYLCLPGTTEADLDSTALPSGQVLEWVGKAKTTSKAVIAEACYANFQPQNPLNLDGISSDVVCLTSSSKYQQSYEFLDRFDLSGTGLSRHFGFFSSLLVEALVQATSNEHGNQSVSVQAAHKHIRDRMETLRSQSLGTRDETPYQVPLLTPPNPPTVVLTGWRQLATLPPPQTLTASRYRDQAIERNDAEIAITQFLRAPERQDPVKRDLAKRIVTIVAPFGSGKTRLAYRCADLVAPEFQHVVPVELAELNNPGLVPSQIAGAVARALHQDVGTGDPLEVATKTIGEHRILLVLDNCEHLLPRQLSTVDKKPQEKKASLPASNESSKTLPTVINRLLTGCRQLAILATSRRAIGVDGEQCYSLKELSYPNSDTVSVDDLRGNESVRLFQIRAREKNPEFEINQDNVGPIADICGQLEGNPLAIGLAAARIGQKNVQEIATKLRNEIDFLERDWSDEGERRRSLTGAINWSYQLLLPKEQTVFDQLAVFAGGWKAEAARAVCLGVAPAEIERILDRLVNWSLVVADTRVNPTRYRFLETVRLFALERLKRSKNSINRLRARHAAYFAELVVRGEPSLWDGDDLAWLTRFDTEHANIRQVLEWAAIADRSLAARIAGRFWRYWQSRALLLEGRDRIDGLLDPPIDDQNLRALLLVGAMWLARASGDTTAALDYGMQASTAFVGIDDTLNHCRLSGQLGVITRQRGDYQAARYHLQRYLDFAKVLGDKNLEGLAYWHLGMLERELGDSQRASAYFRQALTWMGKTNLHNVNLARIYFAMAMSDLGQFDTAEKLLTDVCGEARASSWVLDEGICRYGQALIARKRGETLGGTEREASFGVAAVLLENGEALLDKAGDKLELGWLIRERGRLAFAAGNLPEAFRWNDEGLRILMTTSNSRGLTYALFEYSMFVIESNRKNDRRSDDIRNAVIVLAALASRQRLAMALSDIRDKETRTRITNRARETLGNEFDKIWNVGTEIGVNQLAELPTDLPPTVRDAFQMITIPIV